MNVTDEGNLFLYCGSISPILGANYFHFPPFFGTTIFRPENFCHVPFWESTWNNGLAGGRSNSNSLVTPPKKISVAPPPRTTIIINNNLRTNKIRTDFSPPPSAHRHRLNANHHDDHQHKQARMPSLGFRIDNTPLQHPSHWRRAEKTLIHQEESR
jgi:hypothetical protein